jgi:hypothetical protein
VGGLYGLDSLLASRPPDPRLRGGLQTGFDGTEPVPAKPPQVGTGNALAAMQSVMPEAPVEEYAGKGELLEVDDPEAFKTLDELWRRQEPLALSRLAQDVHWTAVKGGYAFSTLTKLQDQDVYQQSFAPGPLTRAAVPNKAADLCNKLTETLMVDAARPDPQPQTDDEAAQQGAEMAREFLEQDGGESGTDDATVFYYLVDGATTKASTFAHLWVDPVGGGSVPKQIKAHPHAQDPATPLDAFAVDPETGIETPIPTTDYVLRYVTADGQFTVNPSEAERVWVPKIKVDKMDRRHVRLYPETAGIHDARKAMVAFYCTVGDAKLRWPETVGQMEDSELAQLCDWQPPRAVTMLPPALRARWRQSTGKDKKGTVDNERLLFYYGFYQLAQPDYPEGAYLCVNGAQGGVVLAKGTLSATVEMPDGVQQDVTVTDLKGLDIPIVQVMLVQDPEDGDATGKAVIGRIAGAGEAGATIATNLLDQMYRALNPARFATATSPLTDADIEQSRAGGGSLATIMSKDDMPQYEQGPELPANALDMVDWNYQQMDSAIGLNKPAQGSDDSNEVSGVARKIAVDQSLVSVSRMQHGVNVAWERYWRIKLQLAMAHFSVPQMLRYVGVDGAAKQEWFSGNNFAMVGQVTVAAGTGTLMPPEAKVNYALQLRDMMVMDPDEAMDVMRPAFAKQLGVPENPHVQRIERQVSSWLEGPPEGWEEQQQAFVMAAQQHAQQAQAAIEASPDPRAAQIAPPPQAPWTPFAVLPMDAEPPIAAIRKRRLAHLMAKVEFSEQPPAWQQVVFDAYTQSAQAVAAAAMQAQQTQNVASLDAGAASDAPQGVAA